jgi:hypothetical protein
MELLAAGSNKFQLSMEAAQRSLLFLSTICTSKNDNAEKGGTVYKARFYDHTNCTSENASDKNAGTTKATKLCIGLKPFENTWN